jgi:hypothetical protein
MMRVLVIIGAYFVACVVAATAYAIMTAIMFASPAEYFLTTILGAVYVSPVIAVLAALPASAAITYAERYGRRSAAYYVGTGAAAAVFGVAVIYSFLAVTGLAASGLKLDVSFLAYLARMSVLFCIPGVAGGLSYWWIAGRRA